MTELPWARLIVAHLATRAIVALFDRVGLEGWLRFVVSAPIVVAMIVWCRPALRDVRDGLSSVGG